MRIGRAFNEVCYCGLEGLGLELGVCVERLVERSMVERNTGLVERGWWRGVWDLVGCVLAGEGERGVEWVWDRVRSGVDRRVGIDAGFAFQRRYVSNPGVL